MMARLILFVAVFVTGCATYAPENISAPELLQSYSSSWTDLKDWRFAAKLSVKALDRGFAGRLDWTQKKSSFRILISGPLGFKRVRIEGDRITASMEQNEKIFVGTPEMLFSRATGISIPMDNWRWWLSGSPSPIGGPIEFADRELDNRSISFSQDGWRLSFSEYSSTPLGYLPKKIIGQNSNLSFKLIVSKWTSPESN